MRQTDWRSTARWTTTQARRDTIPIYPNTLTRTQTRSHTCKTCGKRFSDVKLMERHVFLTHTGPKPVLCPVCDKRFDSRFHMLSHYPIHRESDLAQVEPFRRRGRKALSEPSSSLTSVGSIHGISRRFLSEPTYKSFGTKQSYFVSEKGSSLNKTQKSLRVHTSGSDHVRDLRDNSVRTRPSASRIPGLDAGSISAIGSVMGPSRSIVTDEKSNFLQTAEERLIKSRLHDISLAGWSVPSTPYNASRPSLSWGPNHHHSITR